MIKKSISWIYLGTSAYGTSGYLGVYQTEPVDVYKCPHCGTRHHVAANTLPVLDFCWECHKSVDPPDKSDFPDFEEKPSKPQKASRWIIE